MIFTGKFNLEMWEGAVSVHGKSVRRQYLVFPCIYYSLCVQASDTLREMQLTSRYSIQIRNWIDLLKLTMLACSTAAYRSYTDLYLMKQSSRFRARHVDGN